MPCVFQVRFLSITDKNKAVNSEMNEVQTGEGKSMLPMPYSFGVFPEKAGVETHKADAAL